MKDRKQKALELANRYKTLEKESFEHPERIDSIRREVAKIAHAMKQLGYSLPRLILKRQQREQK